MIEISAPEWIGEAAFWIAVGAGAAWFAAKTLARLRRVEENTANHEAMCESRHEKINEALAALNESQTAMREDIAFIKARITGGDE